MMYTDKGKETIEQLWNETLADEEAFGVKAALEALRG